MSHPVKVTLWVEDVPEIVEDEMFATVVARHLGINVIDWTVERG